MGPLRRQRGPKIGRMLRDRACRGVTPAPDDVRAPAETGDEGPVTDGPMVDEPGAAVSRYRGQPRPTTMTPPTRIPARLVPEWLDNLALWAGASWSWPALAVVALVPGDAAVDGHSLDRSSRSSSLRSSPRSCSGFAPGGARRNAAAPSSGPRPSWSSEACCCCSVLAFLPYVVELATRIDARTDREFQTELAALQVPDWVTTLARDVISAVRDSSRG